MNKQLPEHIVVVGASLAGLRAVQTARELGFEGRITLIGEENHLPYDRPPLSKQFLTEESGGSSHRLPDSEELASALSVDVRIGTRATALDIEKRVVSTAKEDIPYDALLIATGVRPRRLPATEHMGGVHVLRKVEDAEKIREAFEAQARIVIIGAGFIGAEVASAAAKRGLKPVILEAAPTPLVRAVGEIAGSGLAVRHELNGVDLRVNAAVSEIVGDDHVSAVRLADGTEIPADLVVVGIGADPATDWLDGSGLTINNGIVCDDTLQAAEGVWAAGDVANWMNPLFDAQMRLEHWTNAGEQAIHAMENILAQEEAEPYEHVPYFWSDWYEHRIQFAGLALGSPVVVSGDWASDDLVALYRDGDRLIGALTINRRGDIMKYRSQIARRGTWEAALNFAEKRNSMAATA